jgi:hypothetical protein
MKLIQMTPAAWANVQDNPIQRNTAEHAKKATRKHLQNASPTHALVAAALLPDGTLVKLDGHTRSALWQDGRLEAPTSVHVTVYDVAAMSDAVELYKQFDNPNATENASDRLAGAFRLHDVIPKTLLLSQGGISSALYMIEQGKTVYEMVGEWKDELVLLDELDASKSAMPSVLICAALLTLRKHGEKALDFWRLYVTGGGTRIDGKSCGVDELTRIVADLRARKMLSCGSYVGRQNQAGRAISCCDAWLQARNYTRSAKATGVKGYLERKLKTNGAAVQQH